jgi:hypothetical protein
MREIAAGLMLLGLVGCAATPASPPVESQRQHDVAPGVAKARIVQQLVGLGFKVTGTDQVVGESPAADASWAECGNVLVQSSGTSSSSQRQFARPEARTAHIVASITPRGEGSTVAVTTNFAARYTNRYRNLPFSRPCESTGALERSVLDAAGQG